MATHNQPFTDIDYDAIPSAKGLRIGIVLAKWNTEITSSLHKGCVELLSKKGCEHIHTIEVPGSYELIYASKEMVYQSLDIHSEKRYDAIIALGCVIQGETPHFDYICQSVAQGLTHLNTLSQAPPVLFGVLTDLNIEQSRARSGGKYGNKGCELAAAAIEMATLKL